MIARFDYEILEDSNLRDYLLSYYLSKSKVYKLFQDKMVLVNNEFKNDSYNLKKGDIVSILLDEEIDSELLCIFSLFCIELLTSLL